MKLPASIKFLLYFTIFLARHLYFYTFFLSILFYFYLQSVNILQDSLLTLSSSPFEDENYRKKMLYSLLQDSVFFYVSLIISFGILDFMLQVFLLLLTIQLFIMSFLCTLFDNSTS